jgi:hypothetical protein
LAVIAGNTLAKSLDIVPSRFTEMVEFKTIRAVGGDQRPWTIEQINVGSIPIDSTAGDDTSVTGGIDLDSTLTNDDRHSFA